MKPFFLQLTVASVVLAILGPALLAADVPATVADLDKKIQQLKKERVAVLQKAVEYVTVQYREGATGFKNVVDIQHALLDAELSLARTLEKKIEILTTQSKVADDYLKVAEAQFRAGNVSVLDVQQAKSNKLRIDIHLLQHRRRALAKKGK